MYKGVAHPSRTTQPYPEVEVKRVFRTLGTFRGSYRGTSKNDPDPHNTQGDNARAHYMSHTLHA